MIGGLNSSLKEAGAEDRTWAFMEQVISSRDQLQWSQKKKKKKILCTSKVQQWDPATTTLLALKHHIFTELERAAMGSKQVGQKWPAGGEVISTRSEKENSSVADGQVIIIGRNKAQREDGPTNINTQKPT